MNDEIMLQLCDLLKKCLEKIKDSVDILVQERDEYKKKLQEFENKEKEDKVVSNEEFSVITLSKKEHEAEKAFRQKHYESCSNGNHYVYDLLGTGFSLIVKIKCPVCGAEEDITDISGW